MQIKPKENLHMSKKSSTFAGAKVCYRNKSTLRNGTAAYPVSVATHGDE